MVGNVTKNTYRLWALFVSIILIIGILGFFCIERIKNKQIIIGFSAQLTGKQAELGVQERNGVQLAVEEINAAGGIAGRKISLIIHDDLGIAEEARNGDAELVEEGAVAIIGHATTAQTLEGLKVTNPAKVIMIGPTVSTPELSGVDDYFFRVHPSFENSAQNFAKYIYEHNGLDRMAIIFDNDNRAYSKTYSTTFTDEFRALGGNTIGETSFSSSAQPDFLPMLSRLRESSPEGLLIVASDIDTALIAQRTRLMGWKVPLFAASWAQTETLINSGGRAVEGMELEQAYALASKSQVFMDFQSRYKTRFGSYPSFGAACSYESAYVLAEALKKTNGNKDGLKQALLDIDNFRGLTDTFFIDKFGDVTRPFYLTAIHNGEFVTVDMLSSDNPGGE